MTKAAFQITDGRQANRIPDVLLGGECIQQFFDLASSISDRDLEYLPYMRFVLAGRLAEAAGPTFFPQLVDTLLDRAHGGFFIDLSEIDPSPDQILRFSIAIAHGIGRPHDDVLSGKFYGRLIVKGGDVPPERSNLYQPYSTFGLHTDGAASPCDTTDWIIFAKTMEKSAIGGQTRILHLDDWEDQRRFVDHPFGRQPFRTALPPANDPRQQQWGNHVATRELDRPIFFEWNGYVCVRFADQFIHPSGIEEADYLAELVHSLERSQGVENVTLPIGSLIALNNNYFLHGRTVFERRLDLEREIIRMRGSIQAPIEASRPLPS